MTLNEMLNKVCKWRTVFSGWQLGTRPNTDPECQAVRDQRELLILLRIELSALTACLLDNGVINEKDLGDHMMREAVLLDQSFERRFPGFKSSLDGMEVNSHLAKDTMKGWKP